MKIDLKKQTGEIDLRSGHSMITGNKPKVITNDMFTDIIPRIYEDAHFNNEGCEAFGLWENATPNYTTYYPDVTADDLKPKDEDFIYPIFRCLSATVVWKGYKPIDFSKPGVLKAAMNKLVGQTINVDHETALGNGIGVVKSVSWQESYTAEGVKIPAGINGEFMIDGKSNPRIARGTQSKPPIIHSNSVSVRFEWEPSHKMDSNEDFYSKLGTRDDKGNLYRLVVTKILQFSETSLVAHGADAYAQIVNDGVINNPKYADGVYNFSSVDTKTNLKHFSHYVDYKVDLTSDTTPEELNNEINNNQNNESMEVLKQLEIILGLEADSLKDADQTVLSEAITKFKESETTKVKEDLTASEGLVITLTEERDNLKIEVDNLTKGIDSTILAESAKYKEVILEKRTEAKKLYALAKGDDVKTEHLAMLDTCDLSVLDVLSLEYKAAADLKYPTKCGKCGSTELSKASSVNDDDTNGDKGKGTTNLKEDLKKAARKESNIIK